MLQQQEKNCFLGVVYDALSRLFWWAAEYLQIC